MTEHDHLDRVSGTTTTGHEWDGIKELNTPLPWHGAQLSPNTVLPRARARASSAGSFSISASEAAPSVTILSPRIFSRLASSTATSAREEYCNKPVVWLHNIGHAG